MIKRQQKLVEKKKGFTLIELIVTFGIMTAFMVGLVFNQRDFSNEVSLTGQVHQASLLLRQAQIYGLAVKGSNVNNQPESFVTPYGVHFEKNTNIYTHFADQNIDMHYNGSNSECTIGSECVEQVLLKKGLRITDICGEFSVNSATCNPIDEADVVFLRPQPEAFINTDSITGPGTPEAVQVTFSTIEGKTQKLRVDKAGQISIQK